MKPSLRLALVLACCGLSSTSWAVGLGNIVVRSHLHQRLRAEIAVNAGSPGEAAAVVAELARSEELARAGNAHATAGVDLLVSVNHLADGRAVIVVETNRPVDEPSLSFMIAADAGRGRVLRQYSITLDPGGGLADRAEVEAQPGAVPEAAAPPEALPAPPVAATPARPVASTRPTPATVPTPPRPTPPVASAAPAPTPAPPKPAPAETARPAPVPAAASAAPPKPAPVDAAKPATTPAGSAPGNTPTPPAGTGTIARGGPETAAPAKPVSTPAAAKPAPTPAPTAPAGPSIAELTAAAQRAQAEVEAKEREAAALRDKVKQMEQGTPETRREIEAKNAEIERLRREIAATAKKAESEAPKPAAGAPPSPSPAPSAAVETPVPAAAPAATAATPATAAADGGASPTPATESGGSSLPIWVWGAGGVLLLAGAALLLFRRKKGPAMEWVMPEGSTASPSATILDAPREATVDHATASHDLTFDDLPSLPEIAPVPAPAPAPAATAVMASPVAAPRPPAAPAPAPAAKSPPAVPVGRSPSPLSLEQEVASAQARMPAASSRPSVEIRPLDADLASLADALQEFEPHTPSARAPTVPAPAPAPPPPSKSNPFLRESSGLSLAEQPESHIVPMPGAFEHELHEAFPESPIAKDRHVVDFGDPFKKAPPEPAPTVATPTDALSRALGESVPERATTPQATLESELQAAADAVLGDDDELRAPSGSDAVATKLELARAYLDMDDDESAVHILEEVINEGDAEQKRFASAMLAEARKR